MLVLFLGLNEYTHLDPIASTHIFSTAISHLISTSAAILHVITIWIENINKTERWLVRNFKSKNVTQNLPDCSRCSPLTTITLPLLPDATRLLSNITKHPRQFRTHQKYFWVKLISGMSKFNIIVENCSQIVASDYATVQVAPHEGKNIY